MSTQLKAKLGKATRDAYGEALVALGAERSDIVVLDADLACSTKSQKFGDRFPERFFNLGIQEANMVGVAAGLASSGKIPFASSFASFLICKSYDQARMGISNPRLNVKLVGSHGGISLGEDGASQMSIEDIALAVSLPHFAVVVPADEVSCTALTRAIAEYDGPCFMRTGRPKAPIIHEAGTNFRIGGSATVRPGTDATICAYGLMVWEALMAAEQLAAKGLSIRVIDLYSIKPLDEAAIIKAARETGAMVCAEEHQVRGGMGSLVAQVVAENHPVPMRFVGVEDTYAESGQPGELHEKYGLTAAHIASQVEAAVKAKKK
ncbi:MAG: transketolase family protein [Nitrospirota bacterium]|nr:transketolase family protein [Nitrospirota bacterium]